MSDLLKDRVEKGVDHHHDEVDVDEDSASEAKYGTTQRGLKSRHIQLIALGGCIGTVSYFLFYNILIRPNLFKPRFGFFRPDLKPFNTIVTLTASRDSSLEAARRCRQLAPLLFS